MTLAKEGNVPPVKDSCDEAERAALAAGVIRASLTDAGIEFRGIHIDARTALMLFSAPFVALMTLHPSVRSSAAVTALGWSALIAVIINLVLTVATANRRRFTRKHLGHLAGQLHALGLTDQDATSAFEILSRDIEAVPTFWIDRSKLRSKLRKLTEGERTYR